MRAHHDERLARASAARAPGPHRSLARLTRALPRGRLVSSAGLVAALACAEFTSPPPDRAAAEGGAPSAPVAAPPAEAGAGPETGALAEGVPAAAAAPAQIEASHILVSYQGATRAKSTVTRTREEARALAAQLAARAHEPGTDFAALARESSDGPSGVEGGALPRFGRQQMVKPFSDAAFALRPGEISGVVETNFGFHIIKRTQ